MNDYELFQNELNQLKDLFYPLNPYITESMLEDSRMKYAVILSVVTGGQNIFSDISTSILDEYKEVMGGLVSKDFNLMALISQFTVSRINRLTYYLRRVRNFYPSRRMSSDTATFRFVMPNFNRFQGETVLDRFNSVLDEKIDLETLMRFLNERTEDISDINLSIKEKKQRYIIILINALASTMYDHQDLMKEFLSRMRAKLNISEATWITETNKVKKASQRVNKKERNHTVNRVSDNVLTLFDDVNKDLGVPDDERL